MKTQFALDLRTARRKAGFVQSDIAHLINAHQSAISDLEQGVRLPNLKEIVSLSLIYGRSFESLFGMVVIDVRQELLARLKTLPADVRSFAGTFNRAASIRQLGERLSEEAEDYDAA